MCLFRIHHALHFEKIATLANDTQATKAAARGASMRILSDVHIAVRLVAESGSSAHRRCQGV